MLLFNVLNNKLDNYINSLNKKDIICYYQTKTTIRL